ncbi:hypothetical protein BOTBODRAFT_274895 [Botryobasidium botryosum FD-172 SS1]|uniref:Uncharacterized protein n=1 Tax=Botryobasidium botryosum (strain FD-172 SS1) TaxID=930990 RepID=A0A067MJF6_BOTB1|nr:hypothetical protein BOTBODRAFT_274895 [Botryobasidium botryosum FD-172 SS1]
MGRKRHILSRRSRNQNLSTYLFHATALVAQPAFIHARFWSPALIRMRCRSSENTSTSSKPSNRMKSHLKLAAMASG